jgi:hypothetical protein
MRPFHMSYLPHLMSRSLERLGSNSSVSCARRSLPPARRIAQQLRGTDGWCRWPDVGVRNTAGPAENCGNRAPGHVRFHRWLASSS